jgi:soluble lytic murein transglycosylase-like protein
MRQLLVPTCLFITAWAQPANPVFEFTGSASAENVTIVHKTAAVIAPSKELSSFSPSAAETTGEALARGQVRIPDIEPATEQTANVSSFDEAGFTAAKFDSVVAEVPAPTPRRRPVPDRLVCETLADAAVDHNIPTPFLIRLIWQESRFNQNAVSPVGAQGVAQFMPATAAAMRLVDPFNPLEAVRASAALLRELIGQFGNLGLAAAAYNAGPKRVQDWLARRGSLPKETRDYVQHITGVAPEHWKSKPTAPAIKVAARVPCQREAGLLAANGPEKIPLPPVANDNSKAPETAVVAVASLSQKRKGTKAAPAANQPIQLASAGEVQVKLTKGDTKTPELKLVKSEPKSDVKARPKASVQQAAVGLKDAKAAKQPVSEKSVTKTVSARSKTDKAKGEKGKNVKVANAAK